MDSDDQIDMIWEKYWLGRPTGTHYSEGTSSALLFGDDGSGLETHARRGSRVEDEESDEEPELLKWAVAIGAGVLIGIGAVKAAPRVKSWWRNLRGKRAKDTSETQMTSTAEATALSGIPVEDFTHAVDDALSERNTMTTAEAERRIVEILLAAGIIAKNMRELSSATIEDGASVELQQAIERLTLPNLTDRLNRMLESDSSALDAETAAVFAQIFGGGRIVEGEYVPVQNDKVKNVLRLPDRAA